MSDETRWERRDNAGMRDQYDQRFRKMHAEGADIAGEARFIDALLDRNSTVLDAGCGSGRLTAELNLRGHHCVGVDKDADLLRTARDLHGPGHDFIQGDLADLAPQWMDEGGCPVRYDLIAAIGNVMVFLAPGSERQVLRNFASLLGPSGRLVTGFATDHDYSVEQFDADAAAEGFSLQHRFGTWQLGAFGRGSEWATSVLTRPAS